MSKISSRFSIAVHILSILARKPEGYPTSERLAASVNTNPVVIRQVLSKLKKTGLVGVRSGVGGAYLLKKPNKISLLDVYKTLGVVEANDLFNFHDHPNPKCPVGANIEFVLRSVLVDAQSAMEAVLGGITLERLVTTLNEKIEEKAE